MQASCTADYTPLSKDNKNRPKYICNRIKLSLMINDNTSKILIEELTDMLQSAIKKANEIVQKHEMGLGDQYGEGWNEGFLDGYNRGFRLGQKNATDKPKDYEELKQRDLRDAIHEEG